MAVDAECRVPPGSLSDDVFPIENAAGFHRVSAIVFVVVTVATIKYLQDFSPVRWLSSFGTILTIVYDTYKYNNYKPTYN